jgi:hypothetical protein
MLSMSTLRTALQDLAARFAVDVLAAIRGASLQELLAETGGAPRPTAGRPRGRAKATPPVAARPAAPVPARARGGRLARRSPADIEKALGLIVAALKAGPMRSEQIQRALGLDKRELPRVLKHGLATKKLKAKGQKRATMYSA